MQDPQSFVRENEVWTPEGTEAWKRSVVGGVGLRVETIAVTPTFRTKERLVSKVIASSGPELLAGVGGEVAIGLPVFRAQRLASVIVLKCKSEAGRGGCIEIWEPNGTNELVHAEGYYGALGSFELSSRLARFKRGVGLPGITWDGHAPHVIEDVRTSPSFLRAALAREHGLAVGVGIPIVSRDTVTHVIAFLTSENAPLARAVETWIPDAQGRLWIGQGVYRTGLEAFARSSRTTCLMRGEGIAGRASSSGEPVLWSRYAKDGHASEHEAARAGLVIGAAIPFVESRGTRAVLVVRS
jgi:hypothetical protein